MPLRTVLSTIIGGEDNQRPVSRFDLLPLLILVVAVLLFFGPVIIGRAWIPAGGGDLVSFIFPMYRFASASLRGGEIPLWNPNLYAGAPFIADNQSGVFYPINLLLFLLIPNFSYQAIEGLVILHIFLAGATMYFCLRWLQPAEPLRRTSAIFGGLAFMFSGVFVSHIGNLNLDSTYFWQCRAIAPGVASSEWSQYIVFSLSNVAPSTPMVVSPQDGDTVLASGPTLSLVVANAIDDGGPFPLEYTFELYDSTSAQLLETQAGVIEGSGVTSWLVPEQYIVNATYFWRAQCDDGEATSSWTNLSEFTIFSSGAGTKAAEKPEAWSQPLRAHFKQGDVVTFHLPADPVDLLVISSSGETVYLAKDVTNEHTWSGLNMSGNDISTGVYLWYYSGKKGGWIVVKP